MNITKLSETGFHATFTKSMESISNDAEPPFDYLAYLKAIPDEDFEGHRCDDGRVQSVYQNDTGQYQHVLLFTKEERVFMVIVLDLFAKFVCGHILLDLNQGMD